MNKDLKDIKSKIKTGNLKTVKLKLDILDKKFENNPTFLNMKAIYLSNSGNYDEAIRIWGKLLKKMPHDWAIFYNLAVLFRLKGHPVAALEAIQKSIRISPFNPVAHFEMAHILTNLGKRNDAVYSLFKSIELDNLFFPAYVALSFYLLQDRHKDMAIQLYEKAIQAGPHIQFFKDRLQELKGL